MNKLITLLLVAMLLFIIACSEEEDSPLVGRWTLTSISTSFSEYTEELCSTAGYTWENDECIVTVDATTEYEDDLTWTFNVDNSFIVSGANNITGTWSTSGDTLTLTSDNPSDEELEGTYSVNDNILEFITDIDGVSATYAFTKQ